MSSAFDTRLEVGGDTYWVRRDFDLVRRVEQAFGALGQLDKKLRQSEITADALARLFDVMLKAQASRPPLSDIQDHVLEVGIHEASAQLATVVVHLFAGNRRAVAWLRAEAEAQASPGDAGEVPPKAA